MTERTVELPTGTVTLLFTDIEGSTRLLHALGDGYAEVLARHRVLLRDAFSKWNGTEVDTQGDSFFVVFTSAHDAVSAAAEAQRALHQHKWPSAARPTVRMGLHTGEPDVRPTGYVGVDVHRAARIANSAHGGQIVISSSTYELLGEDLPQGLAASELGHFRLKDLERPVHLYELKPAGRESIFPPLRTVRSRITNLPAQLTSFVGRASELKQLGQMMADPNCRILTLVGPGGVGKTRLALETAQQQLPRYGDGVYFIPLAPLSSTDHLIPTMAGALQFMFDTHSSDLDPKSQLIDYLGDRSVLLLMDNFEHLITGADLLLEITERAPDAQILVTSRERLNLQSEWTFDVGGMLYPSNGDGANLDEYSALQLFHERAHQVDPDFEVTEEQSKYVSRICQLTNGMPLGIELATAWVRVLSCREIAEEIEKSIDFLATTRRDVPERHRSLRAAFEYSWNLLPQEPQAIFARLSVFRGGFSREAAHEVADARVQLLSELMNRSFIRRSTSGRFEMHELLRQLAHEKLSASPNEEFMTSRRHSEYYIGFLRTRLPHLNGKGLLRAKGEIEAEADNLRAAVHWSVIHWEPEPAVEALLALRTYFLVQGWHEGLQEAERIVQLIEQSRMAAEGNQGESDPVYLAACALQAGFMTDLGLHEESERISRLVLKELPPSGMHRVLAQIMANLTVNAAVRGDHRESIQLGAEALAIAQEIDHRTMVGALHLWIGWDHYLAGEYDEAYTHWDQSYHLYHAMESKWGLAFALSKLGLAADALKDFQRALDYHHEAQEIFVRLGDRAGEAYTLGRLSMSLHGLGRIEESIRTGRLALEIFESIGHRWGIGNSLCRIGFPVLESGDIQEARRLFYSALDRALEFKMDTLALYALAGLASALSQAGNHLEALEMFGVFLGHPKTPAIYKDFVQKYVEATFASCSQEEIDAADATIEDLELGDFARAVQAKGRVILERRD